MISCGLGDAFPTKSKNGLDTDAIVEMMIKSYLPKALLKILTIFDFLIRTSANQAPRQRAYHGLAGGISKPGRKAPFQSSPLLNLWLKTQRFQPEFCAAGNRPVGSFSARLNISGRIDLHGLDIIVKHSFVLPDLVALLGNRFGFGLMPSLC
jgi:hypothetical protein